MNASFAKYIFSYLPQNIHTNAKHENYNAWALANIIPRALTIMKIFTHIDFLTFLLIPR